MARVEMTEVHHHEVMVAGRIQHVITGKVDGRWRWNNPPELNTDVQFASREAALNAAVVYWTEVQNG